jgi:apolipoprotein N-acyltransferase
MGIFAKREDPAEGRRRHVMQSLELERDVDPDLIVWPESAYAWFLPEGEVNVKPYVMGPIETPLLFGGLTRRTVDGDERHYNTAVLLDEDGDIQGTYDKTYLLAFGEYLPFGDVFPVLYDWSPHSGRFTPGDHVRPVILDDRWRITALVCYEDILPSFTRKAVAEGDPHLLVNMTNDAWFGDTSEPWQHLALAKLRAVEHHRFLVRATNSGVSSIVDPVGRTLGEVGVFERGNLHADVAMLSGWTPYQTLGNWPGWLSLAAILAMAFWKKRSE